MKSQKIGITALITLLTTVLAPFTPNFPKLLSVPAALSQAGPAEPSLQYTSYDICDIRAQSMLPNIKMNDHVLINKLAYRSQLPKRGDIIVFQPTQYMKQQNLSLELNTLYMKRVIGLPGETVKMIGGKVYVNNKPLEEKYVKNKPNYLFAPVTIPNNSYFVLGDNRIDSYDSHAWGFLPQELIVGQVVRVVKTPAEVGQKYLKSEVVKPLSARACYLY